VGQRACGGYPTGRVPRRRLVELLGSSASPTNDLPLALSASPIEIGYFDLFRQVTATSTLFDSEFWQRDLLQLTQAEPAIWHATVAVGALQAGWHAELRGADPVECKRHAVTHYGKALALARELDCAEKAAALSLVLMATTNMLGRWSESQLHILASLRMPAHQDTAVRMDFQAMTYSDSESPYPYAKTSAMTDLDHILQDMAEEIQTCREAGSQLFAIMRAYFLLDEGMVTGQLPQGPFLTRYEVFLRNLCAWERCMDTFDEGRDESQLAETLSLRLYHAMLRLLVRTGSLGPETRFDDCLGYFEYIIRVATALQEARPLSSKISLEPGLIIPLYSTVHRCRHSALRHHALDMLSGLNNIEGNWRSAPAARVVARVVAVEEEGLQPSTELNIDFAQTWVPWRAWSRSDFDLPSAASPLDIHVPEAKRVRDVCPMADVEGRRVDLRLLMCSTNGIDPYGGVREEVVYF
jgi:cholestenol Delta-isomerase